MNLIQLDCPYYCVLAFVSYTVECTEIYFHHEVTLFFTKQDQALPQKLIQSEEFATVNCLGINQEASTQYNSILLLFRNVIFKKNITKKNI